MKAHELETQILDFFDTTTNPQDLPSLVHRFRSLADEASIKAALLSLNYSGLLDITANWEFFRPANMIFE